MGRVVSADRLVLGAASRQRLVLLAAAKAAGISPEDMAGRLQVSTNQRRGADQKAGVCPLALLAMVWPGQQHGS